MSEDVEELWDKLDSQDVGQKRYLMYQIFDRILDNVYDELPEPERRIQELEDGNGYIYKLSQDFLTSSSTLEKQKKLEKLREYIK